METATTKIDREVLRGLCVKGCALKDISAPLFFSSYFYKQQVGNQHPTGLWQNNDCHNSHDGPLPRNRTPHQIPAYIVFTRTRLA